MTTLTETAPAAASARATASARDGSDRTRSARQSRMFAPVYRGSGNRRVTGAVVAARDGHRLVLPLERPAMVKVSLRHHSGAFSVNALSTQFGVVAADLENALRATLTAAADLLEVTGNLNLVVQVPSRNDSGADVHTAACLAALDGLIEACELSVTPDQARELSGKLPAGFRPVPDAEGFGVHDIRTGSFLDPSLDAPRFLALLVHRPGSETSHVTACGTLPTGPLAGTHAAVARALSAANGPASGPLADVATSFAEGHDEVLGIVGGHTDSDPLCLLLDPGPGLTFTQRLHGELSGRVKAVDPTWRVSVARQGRVL